MTSFSAAHDVSEEARRKANEEAAPHVKEGWINDVVGGGIGSVVALCPVCFAYVPPTNVAKVGHQNWHARLNQPGETK